MNSSFTHYVTRLFVLIILSTASQIVASAQSEPVKSPKSMDHYLSTSFLQSLFGDRQPKAIDQAKDSYNLESLYKGLYALRDKRSAFISSLQRYSTALDRGAGKLEKDYRLNDVGVAASDLNGALNNVMESFHYLGAELSIDDPEIEKSLGSYMTSKGPMVREILDEYTLTSLDSAKVKDVIGRADQNTVFFDQTIDALRMAILAKRQKSKS